MNPETGATSVIDEVKKVKNLTDHRGRMKQKAVRYLTFHEKQSREEEKNRIAAQLKQPEWVNTGLTAEGKAQLARRLRSLEDDLIDNSPPASLTDTEKNQLYKRQKDLEESMKVGMLPHEDMRRNPPGAVDKHRRWERKNKDHILEWKNIKRALSPDSDEKDLASIEMLRPSKGPTELVTNAQIPGHIAYSSVPQENWDATFGKKETKTKKEKTPEQLAATREKRVAALAKARAARKSAKPEVSKE